MTIVLVLSPASRQQLIEFAGFHGVDSGKYVSKVFNGVDAEYADAVDETV